MDRRSTSSLIAGASPYYLQDDADLYSVSKEGGDPRQVVDIDGRVGPFAVAPDGKRLAFIASANGRPERSYDQPDLWVVDLPGGVPRNLTAAYDYDIGGGLGGDQRAPRGQHPAAPIWMGRAKPAACGPRRRAGQRPADGVRRRHRPRNLHRTRPAGGRRRDVVHRRRQGPPLRRRHLTATSVGDLFAFDSVPGPAPVKLTSFNDDLFGQLLLGKTEELSYTSFDGKRIQGWVLKPPDFDPSKKYPLIVQIHGGPHSAYGNTFTHEFHWMAAKGYVVLFTNPRGSSNYGQDVRQHHPVQLSGG